MGTSRMRFFKTHLRSAFMCVGAKAKPGRLFVHLLCFVVQQDLWKTTAERVDGATEGKRHEDIFNKLFGSAKDAAGSDAAGAGLHARGDAKSTTGLRRRQADLPPRKRKGISLAEYLKQAQLQQETEGQ
jgi:hypothetical protein